jgi:hypothetical protein
MATDGRPESQRNRVNRNFFPYVCFPGESEGRSDQGTDGLVKHSRCPRVAGGLSFGGVGGRCQDGPGP